MKEWNHNPAPRRQTQPAEKWKREGKLFITNSPEHVFGFEERKEEGMQVKNIA
jgi:hypothetical protein